MSGGFSADWLALREPFDAHARSAALAARVRRPPAAPLAVVDLGAGTGANCRYLAPLVGGAQTWQLVDRDPALIAAMPHALARAAQAHGRRFFTDGAVGRFEGQGFDCRVRVCELDLAAELDALALDDGTLVTAAALLDLVSGAWLDALAARCAAARAQALFALTYDGRMNLEPAVDGDALVRELVNAHQRTDKGFGPALGPAAAGAAVDAFERVGYETVTASSDWRIPPEARAMQTALVDGWHGAAREIGGAAAAALLDGWRLERLGLIASSRSTFTVGHTDLFACRPGTGPDSGT